MICHMWSFVVLSYVLPFTFASNLLTSENCASFDQDQINGPTVDAHSTASEYLLNGCIFARIVEGYASLAMPDTNFTGGATNTDGGYFSYSFNASVLPDGVCDQIPNHNGDPICVSSSVYDDGETKNFMLGPSDAIVFYGCTPPPVEYFGYDFIITTRFTDTYPFYPGTNFQDALSFRDLNVTDDATSDNIQQPFDRPALFVHTTSSESADAIASAYTNQAGLDPASVTVHQLDSNEIRLLDRSVGWEESKPDLLATINRVTMPLPNHNSDYEKFLKMTFPVRLYMASDDKVGDTLFTPELRSRETGGTGGSTGLPTEKELLEGALWDLTNAIMDKHDQSTTTMTGFTVLNFTNIDAYDNWDEWMATPSNLTFVAGTRDATYGQSPNLTQAMLLRNTSAGVMIGAIHTSSNMSNVAAYFQAGVDVLNMVPVLVGSPLELYSATRQAIWYNENELQGSAARYLPDDYDQDLASKLFAVDVYPEGYCSQPEYASQWCAEYSKLALNPIIPSPYGIPPILLPETGERIYSVEASDTGPSQYETLPSRFIGIDFQGPCAQQFNGIRCRSDGVVGYSIPCDDNCTLCTFDVWEDSPLGYLVDPILECSENDDGATQLFCDGDQLKIYNYDNCQDKNCQIISYPSPPTDNDDANVLCFFAGTKDSCTIEESWKFQLCPNDHRSELPFETHHFMKEKFNSIVVNEASQKIEHALMNKK